VLHAVKGHEAGEEGVDGGEVGHEGRSGKIRRRSG
jgi:hypothetical protein